MVLATEFLAGKPGIFMTTRLPLLITTISVHASKTAFKMEEELAVVLSALLTPPLTL
jgi:hypothetical protein